MGKVDTSNFDKAIAHIEKQWGKDSWRNADEYEHPMRISTGSLLLDAITWGGIPMNRWSRFWGEESSGKSLQAFLAVKKAQEMGMKAIWYDVENQFDERLANAIGVNLKDLPIYPGTVIEEVCDKLRTSLSVAHLHVIDSTSNGNSLAWMNAKVGQLTMGDKAKAWQYELQRATEFMNDDNAVIMISQEREALGNPMAKSKPEGGRFMGFHNSLTLKFELGQWLYYDKQGYLVDDEGDRDTLTGRKEPNGREVKVTVTKSRVCPPLRTSVHWLDYGRIPFGEPYDQAFEYQVAMGWLGMYNKAGSWFDVPNYGRVQGKAQLRQLIRGNLPLQEEIREALLGEIRKRPEDRRRIAA
jgi:RecA/RadA recombinase